MTSLALPMVRNGLGPLQEVQPCLSYNLIILPEKSMNQNAAKSNGAKGKGKRKEQEVNEALPKERVIKKAKNVGRPSKNNKKGGKNQKQQHQSTPFSLQHTTQAFQDPNDIIYDNLMKLFIDFFDEIQKRGFVFKKDERRKLQRETGNQWTQEAEWNIEKEQTKIRDILSGRNLNQEQYEKIGKVLMETSGLHSQEFTDEYYLIVVQIYETVLAEKAQGFGDLTLFHALADAIFSNQDDMYQFFSFKFRQNVFNIKDGFEKPTTPHAHRNLVIGVKNELNKL